MTHRMLGVALAFSLLGVEVAAAQVRQITGRVTNAQTEQGIPEATIAAAGTQIVAQAGNDGQFVMNVPDGDAYLTVRAIVFKRQVFAVPSSQ